MASALCDMVKTTQAEREKVIAAAVKKARRAELELLQTMAGVGIIGELRQICDTLLAVAQKYVPASPSAFLDADSVTRCARSMQRMALQPRLAPQFSAPVASTDSAGVTNSFDYRYLRNKAIAGFATIADLTTKSSAVGTAEYQNGVREGYRRASELAILFLSDIQGGGFDGR